MLACPSEAVQKVTGNRPSSFAAVAVVEQTSSTVAAVAVERPFDGGGREVGRLLLRRRA